MVTTSLAVGVDGEEYLPRLLSVRSTGTVDRVLVRMLPGQVLDDWTSMAPRLAQTFDAQDCRVRTTRHRQQLELWFLVEDPLTATDLAHDHRRRSGVPDLAGLPVARREDGLTYRLRLLGHPPVGGGCDRVGQGLGGLVDPACAGSRDPRRCGAGVVPGPQGRDGAGPGPGVVRPVRLRRPRRGHPTTRPSSLGCWRTPWR